MLFLGVRLVLRNRSQRNADRQYLHILSVFDSHEQKGSYQLLDDEVDLH